MRWLHFSFFISSTTRDELFKKKKTKLKVKKKIYRIRLEIGTSTSNKKKRQFEHSSTNINFVLMTKKSMVRIPPLHMLLKKKLQ